MSEKVSLPFFLHTRYKDYTAAAAQPRRPFFSLRSEQILLQGKGICAVIPMPLPVGVSFFLFLLCCNTLFPSANSENCNQSFALQPPSSLRLPFLHYTLLTLFSVPISLSLYLSPSLPPSLPPCLLLRMSEPPLPHQTSAYERLIPQPVSQHKDSMTKQKKQKLLIIVFRSSVQSEIGMKAF